MRLSALRHRLYEEAVQTPDKDVETFERLFARLRGRAPRTLREDFCGTALLCARWVESDDDREAEGVDLDRAVLAYGARTHVRALEDDSARVSLVRRDVRERSARAFDVICAMNLSWALFDDAELAAYLASARDCLEDDGVLILELFGGAELERPLVREHRHDGFTYVWEQRAFDPARRRLDARIHFRLDDGRELRDAFAYRFVLRSPARIRELLGAAGFGASALWLEDRRGRYRRCAGEPRAPLYRGLFVAAQ